jgi:hypothetical protein
MNATADKRMSILINILCLAAAALPALIIVERLLAAAAATAACTPLSATMDTQDCEPTRAIAQEGPADRSPQA